MEKNMQIYDELQARGLLAQLTDPEEIKDLINAGKARTLCTSATLWPFF